MPPLTHTLTYLTADIPGTGGVLRQRPEDFLVEELPLYPASGVGEHLFLFVEKREQTTSDVIRRLAKTFNVSKGDVGYAGLKDKHAITRQHFSIRLPDPSRDAELCARLDHPRMKILWSARHGNKLRRGHLAGNRFVIHIRQVDPAAVVRAKLVLDRLAALGIPNFLGEQRFGYRQNNHLMGRMLLLGKWQELLDEMLGQPRPSDGTGTRQGREAFERQDYAGALEAWPRFLRHERQALDALRQGKSARDAVLAVEAQQREYLLSSLQSAMFNQVLDRRLGAGLLHQLVPGDLAWKHDNGAIFAVDQAVADTENAPTGRVPALAVSPTGPMWGVNMPRPGGLPAQWEADVLREFELSEADLAGAPHGLTEGSRRPMRAALREPEVAAGADDAGPFIRLAFALPPGSFATIALREIMKPEQTGARIEGGEEPGEERGGRS